ncbi:MAG: hypothetical protein MR799_00560 [Lachnospiraceae bacterium]|nr:hypothetical protein [Lachnospiraceae bacterium]
MWNLFVYVCLVFVPIVVFNLLFNKYFINIKNRIFCSTGVLGIILFCLFLTTFVLTNFTDFETLLLETLISFVGATIYFGIKKVTSLADLVCRTLCYIAVAIVIYSILTFGQTVIDSDVATANLLAQAQLKYHSLFPESWCYANGDLWVISTNIFTMPFYIMLDDQSLARMCGSALLVLLTLGAMVLQSKKFLKNDSWIVSIPLFTLFSFGAYSWNLYQAAYTSQMLWMVLIGWWVYEALENKNKKYYIAYFVIIIPIIMGGIRSVAELIVPILGAILIYRFFVCGERNINKSKIGKLILDIILISIPVAIGYGSYIYVSKEHMMNNTTNNETIFVSSLNDCWNSLELVFQNLLENFGFKGGVQLVSGEGIRNLLSIGITLIIVFICPYLQYRCISKENKRIQFFFWFGIVHNLEMLILVVFVGKTSARYLLTVIYVCIIISSVFLINHIKEMYWRGLFAIIMTICVITYGGVMLQNSVGWNKKVSQNKEVSEVLVQHGLHKGYASYWNAYNTEIYSDMQLEMVSFGAEVPAYPVNGEFRWLVDNNRFNDDKTKTFLMLTEEENELLENQISTTFGNPSEIFTINNKYVYVWDYDIVTY